MHRAGDYEPTTWPVRSIPSTEMVWATVGEGRPGRHDTQLMASRSAAMFEASALVHAIRIRSVTDADMARRSV
jgi:hypothetical protein